MGLGPNTTGQGGESQPASRVGPADTTCRGDEGRGQTLVGVILAGFAPQLGSWGHSQGWGLVGLDSPPGVWSRRGSANNQGKPGHKPAGEGPGVRAQRKREISAQPGDTGTCLENPGGLTGECGGQERKGRGTLATAHSPRRGGERRRVTRASQGFRTRTPPGTATSVGGGGGGKCQTHKPMHLSP